MWELRVVRERRAGYGLSGEPITSSSQVFRAFRERFEKLDREEFIVILLDGKGRILGFNSVSTGSLTASLVHPREVFKTAIIVVEDELFPRALFRRAIRSNSASVILVHNHPSGDPTPSPEDIALTNRLRSAGDLVGIRIVDHVVIGDSRYVSFVDSGRF
ncbi:MAG TPA: JAB domain-containing protein [Candidatus Binatia bacterium]|nr:JAB domain-containing protein [Candidatus Binatia bacterium]